jgi:hypothetical protein
MGNAGGPPATGSNVNTAGNGGLAAASLIMQTSYTKQQSQMQGGKMIELPKSNPPGAGLGGVMTSNSGMTTGGSIIH